MSKSRIGTIPYVARYPERVSVYNSDYDEFGCRVGRDENPWLVERGGRLLGSYATHPQAMTRAVRMSE